MFALLRAKRYQTVAIFTENREADNLRDELQKKGIDAITASQPMSTRDGESELEPVEVQVASADFERACNHISSASRPKTKQQFTLRALLIGVTITCVFLALVRQFGFFAAFWAPVFLLLGGFAIVWGVVFVHRGRSSRNWPYARGTIIRNYIDWDGENYSPKINYRFSANGQEYTGDTVSYLSIDVRGTRVGHELARRRVAKYPVGLEVDVFYDPLRPTRAVLERGGRIRDAVLLVSVGLVLIVGAACWVIVASDH